MRFSLNLIKPCLRFGEVLCEKRVKRKFVEIKEIPIRCKKNDELTDILEKKLSFLGKFNCYKKKKVKDSWNKSGKSIFYANVQRIHNF